MSQENITAQNNVHDGEKENITSQSDQSAARRGPSASAGKRGQRKSLLLDVTEQNCELCDRNDTISMVSCDKCRKWFHYDCVNVDGKVKHRIWHCNECKTTVNKPTKTICNPQTESSTLPAPTVTQTLPPNVSESVPTSATGASRSQASGSIGTRSSRTSIQRKKELELKFLNEKMELHEAYKRKEEERKEEEKRKAEGYKQQDEEYRRKEEEMLAEKFRLLTEVETDEEEEDLRSERTSSWVADNVFVDAPAQQQPPVQSTVFSAAPAQQQPPVRMHSFHTALAQQQPPVQSTVFSAAPAHQQPPVRMHSFHTAIAQQQPLVQSTVFSAAPAQQQPLVQSTVFSAAPAPQQPPAHLAVFSAAPAQQQLPIHTNNLYNISAQQPPQSSNEFYATTSQQQHLPTLASNNLTKPTWHHTFPTTTSNYQTLSHQPDHRYPELPLELEIRPLTQNQISSRHVIQRELPIFNGSSEEWPLFISCYENTTRTCGFSNEENLYRLQKCLKGSALEAVRFRLLVPSAVPDVISTLRMLYGRPERVIYSLLEKLRNEPGPKADNFESLIKFALNVQNICSTMEGTGLHDHLNNPLLLQELINRLPGQIRLNWAVFQQSLMYQVTLTTFSRWLSELAQAASTVSMSIAAPPIPEVRRRGAKDKGFIHIHTEEELKQGFQRTSNSEKNVAKTWPDSCYLCKLTHPMAECERFKQLQSKKKWIIVREGRLCRSCFGRHQTRHCKTSRPCGKNGCDKMHNPQLHEDRGTDQADTYSNITTSSSSPSSAPKTSTSSSKKSKPANTRESITESSCNTHQDDRQSILFRIVPVTLHGNTKSIDTYAFLDEGSSLTLLEEAMAAELGLGGTPEPLCLKWTADTVRVEQSSKSVSVGISNRNINSHRFKLQNVRTVAKLNLPSQTVDMEALTSAYQYLADVPVRPFKNAAPMILIGIDNWKLALPLDVREGSWKEPMATKTRLGWTVHGCYNLKRKIAKCHTFSHFHACECIDNEALHRLVKEFFAIESIGVDRPSDDIGCKDDQRSRKIMVKTTKRVGDRFETGLLWKYDVIRFPESFQMAKHRLTCLEKKMAKDPIFGRQIKQLISDYLAKGYARKLTVAESQQSNPRTWYLPIFTVTNPNKPGKIRLVWDAAAMVNNISLNTMLMTGPDQLTSLPGVLHRFRQSPIAICGDIREMFHQIRIRSEDQDSQRFLWRDGVSSRNPDIYVMNVMTFGATCSPSSAQFIKNSNAADFADQYPRAATAITNNHYVDDWLDACDNEEQTIKLAKEVRFIHSKAGLHITNWVSNSAKVLQALGERKPPSSKSLDMCPQTNVEKVLGMWWCTTADEFTYNINVQRLGEDILNGTQRPTKRQILKILMSIFDPLGFLSFFTVYIKILLREIWHSKLDWDQQITDQQFEKWLNWIRLLPRVRNIRIPRCYAFKMPPSERVIQLHVFVDASENAISAVGYFRTQGAHIIECSLIGARTKVSPQQILSIPRLELQAAVLGARLSNTICKNHTLRVDQRFFWSDSKTVLSWLNSEARNYRQFVAHRVSEILETTELSEWRWVPTKVNVADDATKWKATPDLSSNSRWFNGPEFLLKPSDMWPEDMVDHSTTNEELRSHHIHIHHKPLIKNVIDIKRFSNWNRLVRATSFMFRFIHNSRSKRCHHGKRSGPLESAEYKLAENYLFCRAQADYYSNEIIVLRMNENLPVGQQQPIEKNSPLLRQSPYLDGNGVLRIRGRIDAAPGVPMNVKRPILLPRSHYLTHLIVFHYHKTFHHHNNETTINELRQRFYIPQLRVVLKVVRRLCQRCKIDRATPIIPEMASLPDARLMSFVRPFSYIGIDYFGPMVVTVGRRSEKRWGVLITCMTIRAIHIEIAHALTTDSCIMCIQNFIARRGQPIRIQCDNGTNFHGAANELKKEIQAVSITKLQEKFVNATTEWVFNPPASPHMGGSWERLVRSVKKTLHAIIPTRHPNDEMLRNLLMEVENIVNSRPLTYVPVESDDDEALTPNHFLLGSSNGYKPPGDFTADALYLRKGWRTVQYLTDCFWKRWVSDYLPTLTRRTKWFAKAKTIEVGDLVVIVDECNPRNCWPRGIVLKTIPSRDGQVRQALVKTSSGVYKRPAHKIAVLDVVDQDKKSLEIPLGSVADAKTIEDGALVGSCDSSEI